MKNNEFVISFEKRLLTYSVSIIRLTDTLPRTISIQIIVKQLIRSATSIGANFREAQAGGSKKDFANFLRIALKSANETEYWLVLLQEIMPQKDISKLREETKEICRILTSIIKKLSNS